MADIRREDGRCAGRSRYHERQCRNFPILGGKFCKNHGGLLPNLKKQADINVEMEKAKAANKHLAQPRDPWTVLLDTGHTADILFRMFAEPLTAGQQLTADQARVLNEALDRANRLAKVTIDAGLAERMVREIEDDAQRLYMATKRAAASLGLSEDDELRLVMAIATEYARDVGGQPALPATVDGQVA